MVFITLDIFGTQSLRSLFLIVILSINDIALFDLNVVTSYLTNYNS